MQKRLLISIDVPVSLNSSEITAENEMNYIHSVLTSSLQDYPQARITVWEAISVDGAQNAVGKQDSALELSRVC